MDDLDWFGVAFDAHHASCLAHSPRRTPGGFNALPKPEQAGWVAAVKQAVESHRKRDTKPPAPDDAGERDGELHCG